MGEKLQLSWHSFSIHGQELFKDLLETQNFNDVTLISDDQHQYRVHKFILCACSIVFKNILTNNPLNSIYLRGIKHEKLESILQFIYLGHTTFNHERMKEFLIVARDLDIKEIGQNIIDENESGEDVNVNQSFEQDENQINEEPMSVRTTSQEKFASSYSLIHGQKKLFKCQQCNFQNAHKSKFIFHVQSEHEGVRYSCKLCEYQAKQLANLQHHIKSKHEGIKYPCRQCDYQASLQKDLKKHIETKHEDTKYFCQQCDYQGATKSYLQRHIKTQHKSLCD